MSSYKFTRLSTCLIALSLFGMSLYSFAQTSRVFGAIQGNVFDQSGSAIVDAKIIIHNKDTGQTRLLSSGPEGSFRAGELPASQYELRVESPGFSPYTNDAIVVSIGAVVPFTIRLAPATVQQQVTVSEQLFPVDPTQTTVATTIGQARIE